MYIAKRTRRAESSAGRKHNGTLQTPLRTAPFHALALTRRPPSQFVLNCAETKATQINYTHLSAVREAKSARHAIAVKKGQTDRTLAARQLFSCYPRIFRSHTDSIVVCYTLSGLAPPLPSVTGIFFPTSELITSRWAPDTIPWLLLC